MSAAVPATPTAAAVVVDPETKFAVTLYDRLRTNDPTLKRVDLSAKLFRLGGYQTPTAASSLSSSSPTIAALTTALARNTTVQTVHFSGTDLEDSLTPAQIHDFFVALAQLTQLRELFVFRGNCVDVSETNLAITLSGDCRQLKVLMLWEFGTLGDHPDLAGALRQHPSLERVTLTLPGEMPYGYLDVYAMCFAAMPKLICLSIQCTGASGSPDEQEEPIFSPDALSLLVCSPSITTLYLVGVGLTDDHTDALVAEIGDNPRSPLQQLDLQNNHFSDDCLFSFAHGFRSGKNRALTSLNLSGAHLTEDGVRAMTKMLRANPRLTHVELDGTEERYRDEFNVPDADSHADYMIELDYELRLNRCNEHSHFRSHPSRANFVEALNLVSDHLGCLFYLLRSNPKFVEHLRMPTLYASGGVERLLSSPFGCRPDPPTRYEQQLARAKANQTPAEVEEAHERFDAYVNALLSH